MRIVVSRSLVSSTVFRAGSGGSGAEIGTGGAGAVNIGSGGRVGGA